MIKIVIEILGFIINDLAYTLWDNKSKILNLHYKHWYVFVAHDFNNMPITCLWFVLEFSIRIFKKLYILLCYPLRKMLQFPFTRTIMSIVRLDYFPRSLLARESKHAQQNGHVMARSEHNSQILHRSHVCYNIFHHSFVCLANLYCNVDRSYILDMLILNKDIT